MTNDELKLCRDWATAPNRKWQTLNRGEWKYQFHEKTLVRYVEEASMSENIVPLLLEWLCSDDCKSYLQQYGQALGSGWTPIRAWYEVSNKAVGNVRAVRLYHALTIEPGNASDGPHVVEDGCVYKVSWTNYWRKASVPDAIPSTSGVSHRVTNVQRDPETGLYSYTIETRERVQQDIPEYLTATDVFRDVKEEQHLGVRGDLDAGGKQASVGNGKIVRRKVSKNADCTHDVQNETVEEKAVTSAVVRKTKTLKGVVTQRTDRSVNDTSPEPQNIGDTVIVEKTAGGKVNITETTGGHTPIGKSSESCSRDAFTHHHSETRNEAELQPTETEFIAGQIVRKSGSLAGDGTANNTVETTTALASKNEYHYTREDGAVVHVIKYRNQRSIPSYPDGAAGLVVNDTENHYSRHDGAISWLTNVPLRRSIEDLKFIKHGQKVTFIETRYDTKMRKLQHREWNVQLHHIRGDAYTDYVNDEMQADISRTTQGVMAVKLIKVYGDKDGNYLAEWKWVSLSSSGNWTWCTQMCKHGYKESDPAELREAARRLMGESNETAATDTSGSNLAAALKDLPIALAAAMAGEPPEERQMMIDNRRDALKAEGVI